MIKKILLDVAITGAGAIAGLTFVGGTFATWLVNPGDSPDTAKWKYIAAQGAACGLGAAGAHAIYTLVTHKAAPVAAV